MLSVDDSHPAAADVSTRLAIPKWPFIAADATLLAVALGMWMSGGAAGALPQLFCLGSVALGAVIMATPFALEAFPPGSWRILAGGGAGGGAASGAEGEWRRQANAAAEAVEHAARANAALENSARRFDARFAPLVEVHKGLEAAVAELREATAARAAAVAGEAQATTREFERLRKDQAEKFKTTETKITALEDTLGLIAAHLRTLSTPPAPVAAPPAPALASAPARASEVALVKEPVSAPVEERILVAAGGAGAESSEPAYLGSVAAFAPAPVETAAPVEEPAVEKAPEEQTMMSRALSRAQSSSETPAVAGIIMARVRRPRKSKPPMPVAAAAAPAEAETPVAVETPTMAVEPQAMAAEPPPVAVTTLAEVAAAGALESPAASAAEAASTGVLSEPTEGETSSALRRSARAKALALRGAEDEEAKKNTPVVFAASPAEAAAETGPTQGELLAREAETIRRKRASRSPLSACSLTANVLIGIGNKPFVRGTGPGLSQDKGVPMEFVEIGQWRWVAPSVGKEPITIRIFKNDEIAASGEDIVLRPGQTIEVSPVFPE